MLRCMIRPSEIKSEKDMLVAIDNITDAICEAMGIQSYYTKGQKLGNIAAKIESLRLKCVVKKWQPCLDKLQESMELMKEGALEFDSAKFSLKDISRNSK